MPYEIKQGMPGCNTWAVVKQGTDEIMGCHPTQEEAQKQLAALYASEPEAEAEVAFTVDLVPEGTWSSDGRRNAPGAVRWRALPLSFMLQTENQEGHDGAVICGRITEITREERADGVMIVGKGFYNASEAGREAAALATSGSLYGVSIDFAVHESEIVAETEDDVRENMLDVEILGATQTPFPAFEGARITSVGDVPVEVASVQPLPEITVQSETPASPVLVAAAPPCCPPAEWFTDPHFDRLTPMHVEGGRYLGHMAPWGVCHIGRAGCVTAPHGSGYSYFHMGEVTPTDGGPIPVGHVTLGTGHADGSLDSHAAAAHYDNTGSAVADVVAGEDEFGIWLSGALRPDVTDEQIRVLEASPPSGDWRRIGGRYELVAALSVNVPGFPVPRARIVDGVPVSLVAAGAWHPGPEPNAKTSLEERMSAAEAEIKHLQNRVAKQGVMIDPLRPLVAARLRDRIKRTKS